MATIKPFRAIRPTAEYAKQIAALPYDVYNREEARNIVKDQPLSFLRIDRAETNFPPEQDIYADCVYEKAGSLLQEWKEKEYLTEDSEKGYYLYELTMNERTQTGIVAVAAVDDYENQIILKHENTREEKEQDRIRHILGCEAQTGPIFLAYRDKKELQELVEEAKQQDILYDITNEDGVRHRVFSVSDKEQIQRIEELFREVDRIYIADGHHRCASAAKVCRIKRNEAVSYNLEAEYNYFLSVLFPQSELEILGYNRVIKDLNGLTKEEFLRKLEDKFELEPKQSQVSPEDKGEFGMYLEGQWYLMKYRGMEVLAQDPVTKLDVSILQDHCLNPILGIQDPRTDKRIDFIGGIRGLGELERRVHKDCAVAFAMKATTMEELFEVADQGMLMPPKSTWFEPKLRSGLFIHKV